MINKKKAVELYKSGFTLQYIGNVFGVSRQRIWQFLKQDSINFETRIGGSSKASPSKSEKWVFKKLKRLNLEPIHQTYNSPFDILIRGNKRIEVKHRTKTIIINNCKYYVFTTLLCKEKIDFYIFICGQLHENPSVWIIPGDRVHNNTAFPAVPKNKTSRSRLFLNNWKRLLS